MLIKRKTPCQNCKDRSPECHGKCEKYKVFKQNLSDEQAMIRAEKHKKQVLYASAIQQKLKNEKKGKG